MRNPSQVVLRPNQWRVAPDVLLANMPGINRLHQALPVHVRLRSQASGAEGATLSPTEKDARVADVVRECLQNYGGSFDPSRIAAKFYTQLDRLLLPGELKSFFERHPDFAWAR